MATAATILATTPAVELPIKTGHPIGFWFIFTGELAERASFYGMVTLLQLYLIDVFLYAKADASSVVHLYVGACYLTPLIGGLLADRFLNKYWLLPPIVLGVATFLLFGAPGLFVGFFLSTVLTWHATFTINSLSHVFGKRRFPTTDDSRNNWLLAILTFGEGWHNNHHRFSSSARQGFYWYEYDFTFYILKVLSWLGIVWDLRPVPQSILEEGRANDRKHGAAGAPIAPVSNPSSN